MAFLQNVTSANVKSYAIDENDFNIQIYILRDIYYITSIKYLYIFNIYIVSII